MKTSLLRIVVVLLVSSASLLAQDYAVSPLSDFLVTYKEKQNVIAKKAETSNFNFTQKLAFYEGEMSELKETFKKARKSEYQMKSVKRAKRHSCKGTSIRGITDCEPVYIKAPNKNMYTKEDWVKIEGTDKITTEIIDDNSSVGIKMSATGVRVNEGVIYTVFKYKPELIESIVENEVKDLFSQIVVK